MEEAAGEGDPAGDLRERKGNRSSHLTVSTAHFLLCHPPYNKCFEQHDLVNERFTLMMSLLCQMEDLDLPEIKRKKIQEKKEEDKKEFKDLFQSDSDSDDGDGFRLKGKLPLTHSACTRGNGPPHSGVSASRSRRVLFLLVCSARAELQS